jgi:hypothetical protein
VNVGFSHRTLAGIMATKDQQRQFDELLTKALVTACVPFASVDNTYLHEALGVVGLTVPSRRQVSESLLDKIAEQTEFFSMDEIQAMDLPAGASDGWRKKSCQGGQGLMNCTVMDHSSAQFCLQACYYSFTSLLRLDFQRLL